MDILYVAFHLVEITMLAAIMQSSWVAAWGKAKPEADD